MIRRGYCSYFVDDSRAYSLPYCCIFYDVTFLVDIISLGVPIFIPHRFLFFLGSHFCLHLAIACPTPHISGHLYTGHLHTGHHHAGHLPDHLVELTSTAGLAEMVTVESVVMPGQVLHRLLTLLTHK